MSDGLQIVISADIQDLTTNLNKAEKATQQFAEKSGNNIKKGAANGQIALTNLTRVVQDAPFGLIAIQNNVTELFSSFNNLSQASGGLGGALKSIGSTLLGPAGALFAFSAVTAIVTGLIQKYGSLSNAIQVLTAKNADAVKSQLEYNKAIADSQSKANVQAASLNILAKNFNDVKLGVDAQLAAFVQLSKIYPEITAGITQENALTKENINLVNQRTQAALNFIQLKAKEAAINAVVQKNEQEIVTLTQQRDIEQNKLNTTLKEQEKLRNIQRQGFDAATYTTTTFLIESQRKKVTDLNKEIGNLNTVNAQYYNQLNPILSGIAAYNKATEDTNKRIKDQKEAQDKLNASREKARKDREKELEQYNKVKAELEANRFKQGQLDFQSFFDKSEKIVREGGTALRKAIKETGFEEAVKTAGTVKGGIQVIPSQSVIDAIKNKDRLVEIVKSLGTEIQNVLTIPFEQFFTDLLTKGELNFKAFADAIIKEITRIIAKLIILKLVEKIGNSILPGAGTAASTVGNVIFDAAGAKAPSIGTAGGLTGGLQLGGQVVFVQRGYDLVGVLNAANGSIRNIG